MRFIFTIEDNCVPLHVVSMNKLKINSIMNELLKHLGVILIVIASVVLILSHLLGWNNINAVQFGSFVTMVVGLVLYIWLNRKCE